MKPKQLTKKDVLYALEYAGKWMARAKDTKPGVIQYRLMPDNITIPKNVAQDVMSHHYKEVGHAIAD